MLRERRSGFERRMLSIELPLLFVRVPPLVGLCALKSLQTSTSGRVLERMFVLGFRCSDVMDIGGGASDETPGSCSELFITD